MKYQKSINNKILPGIIAIIGLFAIVTQLYVNLTTDKEHLGAVEHILRYFTYFTILTNTLVVICCISVLLGKDNFFARPKVLSATAVYITIVAVIYNAVLRNLFVLTGINILLNEILHVIVPALFVLYWLFFVSKQNLQWKDALPWLWYPFIYLIVVLIRGALSNYYPYPFIRVSEIGYGKALLNSLFVTIAFLVVSILFIALAKWMSKKRMGKDVRHN